MTKQDILDYFSDINQVYNDCTRLDSLSNMIDEMALEKENKIDELCKDITIVNQNGIYRPVKNTSAQECYRVIFEIIKLIRRVK